MSEENKEKLENGKKILNEIKAIRNQYKVEVVEDQDEIELSILDRVSNLLRYILNDSSLSAYTAFTPEHLEKWKKRRFRRWFKNLIFNNTTNFLYFILLATITGFLISEAVSFYSPGGITDSKSWVKAILTEVCFIFLSGYKTHGKAQYVWVNALRAGIFTLMVFVISSQTLTTGTQTISKNKFIQERIEFIQEQIKEKDKQIVYYRDVKDWPVTTKQVIKEKSELVEELLELKRQQTDGSNVDVSEIEKYKMYGRAAFRVLLLFISVLITRRIFVF